MAKNWCSDEYENKLLDEILHRVSRELKIKETKWEEKKQLITKEMYDCFEDPVYFIENYLFTDKNPSFFSDKIQTLVPFLLFDFQADTIDKLFDAVVNWERVFIEKSRQQWVSWIVCAFALWGYLFRDYKILFLSQKEDFVDKIWDLQSLFQKIRFMTEQLPKWMLPKDFSIDNHMPRLRIYKPKWSGTGSITWDSASKNASTWGTYKFVFLDEFSKMDNASSINTAVQATTWCIIYNSTPLGKFNEYYRCRIQAVQWKMKHIRLHRSLNPFYTKEWYEWRTKAMTPEQIAQELEISYDASVEWRVYPRFANMPIWDCSFWKYDYDPYLPIYCGIDHSHGWSDPFAINIVQTTSNWKIRIIDSLQLPSYTTIDEAASLLAKQPMWKLDDEAFKFLERFKEYNTPIFVWDPYDTNSTFNDTSISKIFRNWGITLNVPQRNKWIAERIRICQQNMHRIQVNVDTENAYSVNWLFVSCIQNSRYPSRNETSQSTSENIKPVHDQSSHHRTAMEYNINFIIEQEEALWIVGWKRQELIWKQLVERWNMITWKNEFRYE